MAFDGIFTSALVDELKEELLFGKIDKIYQPENYELVLNIHTKNGRKKLFSSVNPESAGLYLSEDDFENPSTPSGFCMLLRKLLQGAKIMDIRQPNLERIIEFHLATRDDLGFDVARKLVFEIMGKHSNIVLVELSSSKVVECIKRISLDLSKVRPLYPGLTYEYPPPQEKKDPKDVVPNDFFQWTSKKFILSNIKGLSPQLAEEISFSNNPFQCLKRILEHNQSKKVFVFEKDKNIPIDFHIIDMESLAGYKKIEFDSISKALSYYFKNRKTSNRIKQKSSDLSKNIQTLIKKQHLKIENLVDDLRVAESHLIHQRFGELLTANLHQLKDGLSEVEVYDYYENKNIIIKLDSRYSISKNAQNYYKSYSKAKRAEEEKKEQIKISKEEIEYLETVLTHLDRANTMEDISNIRQELWEEGFIKSLNKEGKEQRKKKNKQWKPSPLEYKLNSGNIVLVGKNNKENDELTMKLSNKNNIWFHTKDIPGSHVILCCNGIENNEDDLLATASIAAYYSKAQNSDNVPVDYTLIKYVKKTKGAKPGKVIFTNNKTLYVKPMLPDGQ